MIVLLFLRNPPPKNHDGDPDHVVFSRIWRVKEKNRLYPARGSFFTRVFYQLRFTAHTISDMSMECESHESSINGWLNIVSLKNSIRYRYTAMLHNRIFLWELSSYSEAKKCILVLLINVSKPWKQKICSEYESCLNQHFACICMSF